MIYIFSSCFASPVWSHGVTTTTASWCCQLEAVIKYARINRESHPRLHLDDIFIHKVFPKTTLKALAL